MDQTSVGYVFDYMVGLGLFGIAFYLLNGIIVEIRAVAPSGDLLLFANFVWRGSLVIYLVFGAFWLPNKIKEWEHFNGR